MQTSLVGSGTLRGRQLPAVLHEPLRAFPVQVTLHVYACAKAPAMTATASKIPAPKNVLALCVFITPPGVKFPESVRQGSGIPRWRAL